MAKKPNTTQQNKFEIDKLGLEYPPSGTLCQDYLEFIEQGHSFGPQTPMERIELMRLVQVTWLKKTVKRRIGGGIKTGKVDYIVPLKEQEVRDTAIQYPKRPMSFFKLAVNWKDDGSTTFIFPEDF